MDIQAAIPPPIVQAAAAPAPGAAPAGFAALVDLAVQAQGRAQAQAEATATEAPGGPQAVLADADATMMPGMALPRVPPLPAPQQAVPLPEVVAAGMALTAPVPPAAGDPPEEAEPDDAGDASPVASDLVMPLALLGPQPAPDPPPQPASAGLARAAPGESAPTSLRAVARGPGDDPVQPAGAAPRPADSATLPGEAVGTLPAATAWAEAAGTRPVEMAKAEPAVTLRAMPAETARVMPAETARVMPAETARSMPAVTAVAMPAETAGVTPAETAMATPSAEAVGVEPALAIGALPRPALARPEATGDAPGRSTSAPAVASAVAPSDPASAHPPMALASPPDARGGTSPATAPGPPASDASNTAWATRAGGSAVGMVATPAASPHSPAPAPAQSASPTAATKDDVGPEALLPVQAEVPPTLAEEVVAPDPARLDAAEAVSPGLPAPEQARPLASGTAHTAGAGDPAPAQPSVPAEARDSSSPGAALPAADQAGRAAAPSPPRTVPPVPVAWPSRQVAPFAVALALGPDSSLTLTLDPVELGRVEVAIERSRGEAAIRVSAERPETLALLQRDARELERALSDAGFGDRAPTLSFSLGSPGPGQGQPRQGGDGAGGQREAPGPSSSFPRLASSTESLPRRMPHRGLLDLAV
jgi:Meckel syndrome type 1 protein